jgi:hypothetical protein
MSENQRKGEEEGKEEIFEEIEDEVSEEVSTLDGYPVEEEAEEFNEDEDDNIDEEEEDASENQGNGNFVNRSIDLHGLDVDGATSDVKGKKNRKICRRFSYSLINSAVEMQWEEEEITKLINLIAVQLQFDSFRLQRCLETTKTGFPAVISSLLSEFNFELSAAQILNLLVNQASNLNQLISLMGEALEFDLFNLNIPETLDVVQYSIDVMRHLLLFGVFVHLLYLFLS